MDLSPGLKVAEVAAGLEDGGEGEAVGAGAAAALVAHPAVEGEGAFGGASIGEGAEENVPEKGVAGGGRGKGDGTEDGEGVAGRAEESVARGEGGGQEEVVRVVAKDRGVEGFQGPEGCAAIEEGGGGPEHRPPRERRRSHHRRQLL